MRRTLCPGADVLECEVSLRGVAPPVWRRFQIPAAATLAELHEVLQVVLGWTNAHLWEFDVEHEVYGADEEVEDAAAVVLGELVAPGAEFVYTYDLGDEWVHDLTVRQVVPAQEWTRYPRCLDGARACPPEDVGGPEGYADFLEALRDPEHPEHGELLAWVVEFDPERFDAGATDWALTRLAWRPAAVDGAVPAAPARAAEVAGPARIVLRCTGRFLKVLRPDSLAEVEPSPEDWYANLVWIDGRKCLLATHAETLFSVFVPDVRAAGLRPIGAVLVPAIEAALAREGLPLDAFGRLDPAAVSVAKTADRRVLGAMRDLALRCELAAGEDGGLAAVNLSALHRELQRHLVGSRGAVYAIDLVRERVGWGPARP